MNANNDNDSGVDILVEDIDEAVVDVMNEPLIRAIITNLVMIKIP